MSKKTVLITGATQGIGKETAIGLAKQGHNIVLNGRNKTKLEYVCEEIKSISGNSDIDTIVADLSLLVETKRMTDEFISRYDKLDILINNAGVFPNSKRETTAEGLEKSMAINLFSPFLIMQAMKPVLLKSDSARILNVSSAMHKYGGRPDFSDMQFERNYSPIRVYGLTKLYLIWISQLLSKMLKQRGVNNVTVNSLHPGNIDTNFGQDAFRSVLVKQAFKVSKKFMGNPADAAKTIVYLATSPDVKNVSGEYFNKKGKVIKPDGRYWSPDNEKLVMDYCIEHTKQQPPVRPYSVDQK